jgi:hypothetical protein
LKEIPTPWPDSFGARGNGQASKHYAAARLPIRKTRRPSGDAALTGPMFSTRRFFVERL